MGVGWDRGREDLLSGLVGLAAIEDVLVQSIEVDFVECLIDN